MSKATLHDYRFSVGDSSDKGIGLCFSVQAESEEAAVTQANEFLLDLVDGTGCEEDDSFAARVYVGPNLRVTAADIED